MVGMLGESGLASGARVIIEKPFGTDLDSARELNQAVTRCSTSRRSSGSTTSWARSRSTTSWPSGSPTGSSSRSGTVAHPVRADRRAGDAVDRGPGRVLRRDRRLPGHGGDPPVPGARVRGHGAAGVAERPSRCATRSSRCSTRCGRSTCGMSCAGSTRGTAPSRGSRPLRHRDDGRGEGRGGKLALARGAVLPAFGQGHGRLTAGHHARLPRAAAADVPGAPQRTSRPAG